MSVSTKITQVNKKDFAVPFMDVKNSEEFLPLKAMQELFRNTYPEGSVILGEPKLAPEKDGMSYIVQVSVYLTEQAREHNTPDYSRWVKFNPATDEEDSEIVEDPFNAVSRVAEYKALEAIGCGLDFDKEVYMRRFRPEVPTNAPVAEREVEFAKSFDKIPSSKTSKANPQADKTAESKVEVKLPPSDTKAMPAKSNKASATKTASVPVSSVEPVKVPANDATKAETVKTSEVAASKVEPAPVKTETKPVENVVPAKPVSIPKEPEKAEEKVVGTKVEKPVSVPKASKPTAAQIEAAKAVVSSYRNYSGMTMEQIALSAKASKDMTIEQVAKAPGKVHTGWNMIRWFATSSLAASTFPKESAAAKILIAAFE